jgi:hypothetical protein
VADTLAEEMCLHMTEPFPDSVEKGLDYGEVDPVMVDANIYGWATRAGSLSELDQSRLLQTADELERSIAAFPPDAQPYYERILRIARLALDAQQTHSRAAETPRRAGRRRAWINRAHMPRSGLSDCG